MAGKPAYDDAPHKAPDGWAKGMLDAADRCDRRRHAWGEELAVEIRNAVSAAGFKEKTQSLTVCWLRYEPL